MKSACILSLVITAACFFQVSAQETALPEKLSLKAAQQIALKNNPDMEVSRLNTAVSQRQAEEARAGRIPNVYANYDLRRNLIVPTTPVPAKAFDPDAPADELIPLRFSSRWASNAGLNVTFDLFNPQTRGRIKEVAQQALMRQTDETMAADGLAFKVKEDYAACIIAVKQLELAAADTMAKTKILAVTRDQYNAGRLKITDLDQAEGDKNETVSNYLKAARILASARTQLLADMGYDLSKAYSFSFSDSIPGLLSGYERKENAHWENSSLHKQEQQKELTQIQLDNAREAVLPTVSLKGFYGANYFDNNFDLFSRENWYGNSYAGISVNIPITEGLDRARKTATLRVQRDADEAGYRAQQNQIQLKKIQADQEIAFRKRDLQYKEKSMKLARENFQTATAQFSAGRLLRDDLARSGYSCRKAETAYLQAAYDFLLAEMTLEKVSKE